MMMVVNPLTALFYFVASDLVQKAVPGAPGWAFPVLGVFGLVNTAAAVGVWRWKKWGVFTFYGLAAITMVFNLAIGVNPSQAIMGLGGPIVLWLLAKPVWKHFS